MRHTLLSYFFGPAAAPERFFKPTLRARLRDARDHLIDELGSRVLRLALDLLHDYLEAQAVLRENVVRDTVQEVYHALDQNLRRQVPLAVHRVREFLGRRLTPRDEALLGIVDEVAARHRAPAN